jgi:hypothetical protein
MISTSGQLGVCYLKWGLLIGTYTDGGRLGIWDPLEAQRL